MANTYYGRKTMTQWKVKAEIGYTTIERVFDNSTTAVNIAKELLQFKSDDARDVVSVSVSAILGNEEDF